MVKELETQAPSGRLGWSVEVLGLARSLSQAWLGRKGLKDEAGATKSLRP